MNPQYGVADTLCAFLLPSSSLDDVTTLFIPFIRGRLFESSSRAILPCLICYVCKNHFCILEFCRLMLLLPTPVAKRSKA